jgi:oligopeptide transport system ATP-binding protein
MFPLLEVNNLTTQFQTHEGIVHAVNDMSFRVNDGETLGIVGESGSGKSVSMLSVMRLIPSPPGKIVSGQIKYKRQDLLNLTPEEMRQVRGHHIAMIFQDPMTSLNPVLPIGVQIKEALKTHLNYGEKQARDRTVELLGLVGIPSASDRLNDYPHQFSGGMRQRVMIAMALSCNPELLIADEPTTALDVTIQAQIIDLVKRLTDKLGMTVIWITHDLGVVARIANRVLVMYAGKIVEQASVSELYHNPHHPYTIGLLGSLPRLDEKTAIKLVSIPGQPPDMLRMSPGCAFASRCTFKIQRCLTETPQLEDISGDHLVSCWEQERTTGGWQRAR